MVEILLNLVVIVLIVTLFFNQVFRIFFSKHFQKLNSIFAVCPLMINFLVQNKWIIDTQILIISVLTPLNDFLCFLKSVNFLCVLLVTVNFFNLFFQTFKPFCFSEFLFLNRIESKLFAFPMKLINNK